MRWLAWRAHNFPEQGISITRAEYDAAYDQLAYEGVALKQDREAAWQAFAGWRVNYDTVLLELARLIMAPPAQWSTDRMEATNRRSRFRVLSTSANPCAVMLSGAKSLLEIPENRDVLRCFTAINMTKTDVDRTLLPFIPHTPTLSQLRSG